MSVHNTIAQLAAAVLTKLPMRLFKIAGNTRTVLKVGSGVPTGTPDAIVYINTAAGATTAQRIYVDNNGAWAALS